MLHFIDERGYLFLAALSVTVLAIVALALVAFSFASVVVIAFSRFALGRSLLHIRIVVIHNDNGVATFALLVLGVAWVSGTRVMRIVCVLGPALFVAFVVPGFAVFNNNYLAGIAVFLAGSGA